MVAKLQEAFEAAAALPEDEQEQLADRLLADLAAEAAFDAKLLATGGRLAGLATAALAEEQKGLAKPLDPDAL